MKIFYSDKKNCLQMTSDILLTFLLSEFLQNISRIKIKIQSPHCVSPQSPRWETTSGMRGSASTVAPCRPRCGEETGQVRSVMRRSAGTAVVNSVFSQVTIYVTPADSIIE